MSHDPSEIYFKTTTAKILPTPKLCLLLYKKKDIYVASLDWLGYVEAITNSHRLDLYEKQRKH